VGTTHTGIFTGQWSFNLTDHVKALKKIDTNPQSLADTNLYMRPLTDLWTGTT